MAFRSLALTVLFAGLAWAAPDGGRPAWIAALPDQPGRIYAVGVAPLSPGQARALAQAADNARGEVLSRLRATVHAETTSTAQASMTRDAAGHSSGAASQQLAQSTRIQASARDLPGLAVAGTWVDTAAGTVYALAYLDLPVAEGELRARCDALAPDLDPALPEAPRERLGVLHKLRVVQGGLAALADAGALLAAGGGDPALRARIEAAKRAVDGRVEQLRSALTVSLEGAPDPALAELLRSAALKAGLAWSETGGELRLAVDGHAQPGQGWISHALAGATGIVVARAALTLTLQDRAGASCAVLETEAKGLGADAARADRKLREELGEKLAAGFIRWQEAPGI